MKLGKNNKTKLLCIALPILMFFVLYFPSSSTLGADITITASVSSSVTFTVTDSSIAFGTLDLQAPSDTATISSTRGIWESQNEPCLHQIQLPFMNQQRMIMHHFTSQQLEQL